MFWVVALTLVILSPWRNCSFICFKDLRSNKQPKILRQCALGRSLVDLIGEKRNVHIFKGVFLSPFAIVIIEYCIQGFSVGQGHHCFMGSSITLLLCWEIELYVIFISQFSSFCCFCLSKEDSLSTSDCTLFLAKKPIYVPLKNVMFYGKY